MIPFRPCGFLLQVQRKLGGRTKKEARFSFHRNEALASPPHTEAETCRMRITHGTPDFGVDVAKEGLQVSVTQSTDQAIGEAPFLRSPEEKIPPDDENFNSFY